MAIVTVLPQGTYPVGTRMLGPASVPVGMSAVELALDGAAMTDPALQVTILLDLSLDSGATWASTNRGPTYDPFPVTMTLSGGATNRLGTALAFYTLGTMLPSPASTTRQVKATVTIADTPLITSGTLTLT